MNNTLKQILLSSTIATIVALGAVYLYNKKSQQPTQVYYTNSENNETSSRQIPTNLACADLSYAAETSVNTVVHIKSTFARRTTQQQPSSFFEFFFGQPQQQQAQMATGSGVIISEDGYIVTNNHVIENASLVEVILNNRQTYTAKIIGTDKNTDLALLKIEAEKLTPIVIGNSDELRLGEWVLAVGNPFNLNSTITAGIVSAKARELSSESAIRLESFIQTDAAVNPGNSGGALVNARGELVGINTAIASQSGTYEGYSFAIPTSIVTKVISDIKEFGSVQRALLGVQIRDIDSNLAKEKNLPSTNGVYVESTLKNGAAYSAGIKEGDIITHINRSKVNSSVELRELVSRNRPGDTITITINRNEKELEFSIILRNEQGNTAIIKNSDEILGATFRALSEDEKYNLGLNGGLVVEKIQRGKFSEVGLNKGYIVYKVNSYLVNTVSDLNNIVTQAQNSEEKVLFVTAISNKGKLVHYAINLSEK